ncbi:MAG TPA: hypothetical protein VD927_10205 [Chryseosolibacter sp.]|nr:hypothetical protein [Chryseosolibacter sp.]
MLIRKNTKTFKTIHEIIRQCQYRPDREKLVRLYITKAGDSVAERINIEGIEEKSSLFYEMNYQTILSNLNSSTHQLHASEDVPGIYFFHTSSNKAWDETPFEFDEAVLKEFSALPELPLVRKKENVGKIAIPKSALKKNEVEKPVKKSKSKNKGITPAKKEVGEKKRSSQPDFKLAHEIEFTDLERLFFRQAKLSKRDVLNYYYKIVDYILPYVKNRPLWTRLYSDSQATSPKPVNIETLFGGDDDAAPDWMKKETASSAKSSDEGFLPCNDKEHLLLYVERGCVEFRTGHAALKKSALPDYIVIDIDGAENELSKTVDVALAMKEILTGLQLPSLVKTDGYTALHVYVPLDGKNDFEVARKAAEYICYLTRIKASGVVSIKSPDTYDHGKVSIDYRINAENENIISPYSLTAGQQPSVATPLRWEELEKGFRPEEYNYETVIKRLNKASDPFETIFKKKVSASALLERLEENYAFLF